MYNQNEYSVAGSEQKLAAAFPVLMRKVYLWMTLALAITGVTAYIASQSPSIMVAIYSNRLLFWGLLIGEIALVWYVSARIDRLSLTTATLLFALYSVLNGLTLSFIFLAYTDTVIAKAFFCAAGTFAVMSVVGYVIKRDLSGMGRILVMLLIGLIIASVVNLFWSNGTLDIIITYAGVLIFVGLTAYDTQKIKQMLAGADDAYDSVMQKTALLGALSLYLDFINLFLYLLRIFDRN
ncbi:MAG: Bax inhibitor-1/YccA family protein [Paludibacteraceae bacterium]|nr:Bax inhibitor-1/YccA family protein [Paludibacteraceae bacterium]